MAEIKIEKKKAIWPWIIGIIILALLIYFLAFDNRKVTDKVEDAAEEVTSLNEFPLSETVYVTIV